MLNLHLPDNILCGAYFHTLFCHMCIFFGETSVKDFGPFLVGLFLFLLLTFKTYLYIFGNSSLSDMCFTNISSQCVVCLLILSTWSFPEQKFSILTKSNLSIICFMYCTFGLYQKSHCHTQGHLIFLLCVIF